MDVIKQHCFSIVVFNDFVRSFIQVEMTDHSADFDLSLRNDSRAPLCTNSKLDRK